MSEDHSNGSLSSIADSSLLNRCNSLRDEYSDMDCSGDNFLIQNFVLESGNILNDLVICYNTYGVLNENRDNVIVVCHALTGNSKLDTWWSSMLGPGKCFNTEKYFIICANILGSCYGSTGPKSLIPSQDIPYMGAFPKVTIRDTVNAHLILVKDHLHVSEIFCVVGGSMGGMQALEWALIAPDFVRSIVCIACGPCHSPWQIAISETQRQAIYADPKWKNGFYPIDDPPVVGLSLARQIAMISYRSSISYDKKFGREVDDESGEWKVAKYLQYQGKKFLDRFDAITYVYITLQMDSHDIGRGRDGAVAALSSIKSMALIMGIDSDILYPLREQVELNQGIKNSIYRVIHSDAGHDGFLLEQDQVSKHIESFFHSMSDISNS